MRKVHIQLPEKLHALRISTYSSYQKRVKQHDIRASKVNDTLFNCDESHDTHV